MLISCIECGHSISDKAVFCPQCGCPTNVSTVQTKTKEKTVREHRRLRNGFGQIHKLSGNRRNPYVAYPPVTRDMYDDNGKAHPKAIGYFESWYDAYDCLIAYNTTGNPMTFKEVFDKWFDFKFNDPHKNLSPQTKASYIAVGKLTESIHNKPFSVLKAEDLQSVINDKLHMSASTSSNIKTVYNQMYKYAIMQGIVEKDYSKFVTAKADDTEKGEPLTTDEIERLWQHSDDPSVQIVLILVYTGFRRAELQKVDIDLKNKVFRGGVKTDAGKDRVVPIHSSIFDFVKNFNQKKYHATYFSQKYWEQVVKLCDLKEPTGKKRTMHDCRHTFSWLADTYGMDSLAKHMIMGHSLKNLDIEQSVYGHRTLEQLRAELEKIKA